MAAFPLHAWLPEIHHQSPAPINMLISALFQNIGGYTLFRVAYPLFPEAAKSLWLALAILGVISILYGAPCAIPQADLPRLIAYSSISQSGFVVLGIALATINSLNGALFVMIARGLGTAALLFISRSSLRPCPAPQSLPLRRACLDDARLHRLFDRRVPGRDGPADPRRLRRAIHGHARPVFHRSSPAAADARAGAARVLWRVLTAAFILRTIQRIFLGAARRNTSTLPTSAAVKSPC